MFQCFFLTNKELINSLILANKRNVDVRIIVDSAANIVNPQYVKILRENKVPVKVENWGGKMHMKSAVIDDKTIIIGSMNWTGVAQTSNDENTIVLENIKLAKEFKQKFIYLWNTIPNRLRPEWEIRLVCPIRAGLYDEQIIILHNG